MLAAASEEYYRLKSRRGLSRQEAAAQMRRNTTLIAAMMVRKGGADGMLCGTVGVYADHLAQVADVVGLRAGVKNFATMHLLMLPQNTRSAIARGLYIAIAKTSTRTRHAMRPKPALARSLRPWTGLTCSLGCRRAALSSLTWSSR